MSEIELFQLRAEFLRRSTNQAPCKAFAQYVALVGLQPALKAIADHGAMPIVTDVQWHQDGFHTFTFAHEGVLEMGDPALVFEVMGEDGETVIDLCAWSIEHPQRFGTALGAADMLGEYWLTGGSAPEDVLRVHRTPLAWMKAGCDGVVILRRDYRAEPFSCWWGRIAGEDEDHARELAKVLCRPPVDPEMICFTPERPSIRHMPPERAGLLLHEMGVL